VPDNEIKKRFCSGYKYLDNHFKDLDNLYLFVSSSHDITPSFIVSFLKGKINHLNKYPEFINDLLPNTFITWFNYGRSH
jgi:hypothetical protein